jgi:site-specific recombinase XerD
MRRWDRLVELYMEEYAARGVSALTVQKVERELDRWGSWLKHHKPRPRLGEINADLITLYVRQRTVFRSKALVRSVLGAQRGLGEFLVQQGVWASNPLRWMRGPKVRPGARVPRRINRSAMRQLLEGAATGPREYHRHLWLAALAVLYGTGLRREELIRLDLAHWQRDSGVLRIDGRKTGWERCVPLPALTVRCLEAYLVQRHNLLEQLGRRDEPAIFVNRFGGRLKPASLSHGVAALARRCGLAHVTMHQFRHTCASDLLEDGVSLPEVQRLLGHQTIVTTVRYLHIADPQRHAAVRRHPINEMLTGGAA